MQPNPRRSRLSRDNLRSRVGGRIHVACANCKDRKLKCDNHSPACGNCSRNKISCVVEDPVTKRLQPRDYLETLERRVLFLENVLQQNQPETRAASGPSSTATLGRQSGVGADAHPAPPTEEVGDLASKVGMLGVKTFAADSHYLGSSSAFAFSRLVSSYLRDVTPKKVAGGLGSSEEQAVSPSPCPLPDYDAAVQLSNAYFQNIHPQYSFLHEPTFREWETKLVWPLGTVDLSSFEPVPLFFLYIVYAVGALLLPDSEGLSKKLFSSSQLYVDHVLSLQSLESVQALLCHAMYALRSPTGPSIWKLSGMALRQCIELGYHRSVTRFRSKSHPLRLELQRRAFWCTYGLDCSAAIHLGRPLGLSQNEIDAELPLDVNDADLSESGISGSLRTSVHEPATDMSLTIHVIRLRRLWARIHASLYSDTASCNPDHPTYGNRLTHLRAELETWLASAPPVRSRQERALSIFGTRDWFELNYHYCILLLYRGQLIKSDGIADEVFAECLRAAQGICHGYRRQYIGKPVNYTWGSLHFLFTAGLTYLHCIWASPAIRETIRYDDMSKTCTDCTMVLVVMAERWPSTAPYRDLFEALSNRTMTMLVKKNHERWQLPGSELSTPVFNPENDDLTQWMIAIADSGMSDGVDDLLTGLVEGLPSFGETNI